MRNTEDIEGFFHSEETSFIAIPENNAIKTVQQSAKDKEGICRRADARQRYLTQDFTLCWAGLLALFSGIAIVV